MPRKPGLAVQPGRVATGAAPASQFDWPSRARRLGFVDGPKRRKERRTGAQGTEDRVASGADRIKELTQRMLRKRLYVVLSKGAASAEQIAAVLPQHLEYMIGLEKKGVLFASGPLSAAEGAPAGDGLTILRADSVEQARQIASTDPFVVNKLRSFEVREWTLMEGSFGLRINFSDQSLDIA